MIPSTITQNHVEQAMRQIDEESAPAARLSRHWAVEHGGKKYPPKYLVSVAARIATGVDLPASEFMSGGPAGARRLLAKLGFTLVSLDDSPDDDDDDDAEGADDRRVTAEKVEALLRDWYPDDATRNACAAMLADAISWSNAGGSSLWSTTIPSTRKIRLNAGQLVVLDLLRDRLWMTLDEATLSPDALAALTTAGKRDSFVFKIIPGLVCFDFPRASIATLRPVFESAFRRTIERVAERTTRTNTSGAHSNAIPEALERLLGRSLPRPGYASTVDWATLEASFKAFRADTAERARIALRQRRAKEIRALIEGPEALSLDRFDREVWAFESDTRLHGQDVTGTLFSATSSPDKATAEGWLRDLDEGAFELHGNYCWGPPAASSFGAPLAKTTDVEALLREALGVLVDASLTPIEKAKRINAIKGFGQVVSTGLVMLFHPEDFGVKSNPAEEAMRGIGLPSESLEAFERSFALLRERLGAEDAFELDRFLSRLAQGTEVASSSTGVGASARAIVKVAPGEGASLWQDCLAGGFICVGWDELGDLRAYASRREVEDGFFKQFPKSYNGSRAAMTKAARDLWRFRSLREGDIVVANKGKSQVLAVGTVVSSGYEFSAGRTSFKHLVRVQWDTTRSGAIPTQEGWFRTILPLTESFLATLPNGSSGAKPPPPPPPTTGWSMPTFAAVVAKVRETEMRIDERTLRRYHVALQVRGFVIVAGVSGTGKTWLTKAYADAIGAAFQLVAVAPNWTSNEDLLGFFNPLDRQYRDTPASLFLRAAAAEYERAQEEGRPPRPYHLVLDEMNLARVEHYFARFLSALEVRHREGEGTIELHAGASVALPPNLAFIGTVNVDETTHGFADKVYDRAQLIELPAPRALLADHVANFEWGADLLAVWDAVAAVAPFAFRVLDDVRDYVTTSVELQVPWRDALDEQVLQKVLPKLKGTDPRVGAALERLVAHTTERMPLSHQRAQAMLDGYRLHGFASYF